MYGYNDRTYRGTSIHDTQICEFMKGCKWSEKVVLNGMYIIDAALLGNVAILFTKNLHSICNLCIACTCTT